MFELMAEENTELQHFRTLDGRLATVERDVTAINTSLGALGESLSRIEQHQQSLAHQVNTRGQTKWGVVASLVGGVAAVLVFYTGLITQPIDERVDNLRDAIDREHQLEIGYERRIDELMLERVQRLQDASSCKAD